MEEREEILIDRYLAGEASPEERLEVEHRITTDPVFRLELESAEKAKTALRLSERDRLRERFRQRDAVLDKKKPEDPIPTPKVLPWWWIAAAIALILIVWKFLLLPSGNHTPVTAETQDTLKEKYPSTVIIDTLPSPDSVPGDNEKTPPQKTMPDMAARIEKSKELFAEYYNPYKDDLMDPTTRGESELAAWEIFQKAYWEADYSKAVQSFQSLPPSYKTNDNFRFSYASALLANGQTEDAIPVLQSIIENNKKSRYKTEARYALALAWLKLGDIDKCRDNLDTYIADAAAKQVDEAKRLRVELQH